MFNSGNAGRDEMLGHGKTQELCVLVMAVTQPRPPITLILMAVEGIIIIRVTQSNPE